MRSLTLSLIRSPCEGLHHYVLSQPIDLARSVMAVQNVHFVYSLKRYLARFFFHFKVIPPIYKTHSTHVSEQWTSVNLFRLGHWTQCWTHHNSFRISHPHRHCPSLSRHGQGLKERHYHNITSHHAPHQTLTLSRMGFPIRLKSKKVKISQEKML